MGNYLIIQIIASVFLIFALLKVFWKYKGKQISFKEFFFWALLWVVIGVVFWLPQTTSFFANILGIGRGVDLVIYTSIVLIFYLIFRIFIRLDKQQQEITKIVRSLALTDQEEKKENF
jgi:hypothetical protein